MACSRPCCGSPVPLGELSASRSAATTDLELEVAALGLGHDTVGLRGICWAKMLAAADASGASQGPLSLSLASFKRLWVYSCVVTLKGNIRR